MSTRCPPLPTDPGDRNRTSPFAFTGNRFEFRAPGSGQTVAVPLIVINTIMADSLDYMATKLEKAVGDGEDFDKAVQTLLTEVITEHGDVVYNGDGYSEKWQIEAAERGLPNLKTTLDAVGELIKPEAIELFEKYGVFNERELHSRYEVRLEQYALTVAVEAKLAARDRLDDHPAGRDPLPDRARSERRGVEGRRRRAEHSLRWTSVSGPIADLEAGLEDAEGGAVGPLGGVGARRSHARPARAAAGDGRGSDRRRRARSRCRR